jgi:uncharacterized protein YdaU (DUF1376 family)
VNGSAWFPFFSGDYLRDTGDLSLVQHGAFARLLIHYYATGAPLPKDKMALYRIVGAMTDDERTAVDFVIGRFFRLEEDGYHNGRADRELGKQAEIRDRLSSSGKRGAEKRWNSHPISPANGGASGDAGSSANGLSMANPQPHPQPQKDKGKNLAPKPGALFPEPPEWIPREQWDAWVRMRKKIRKELTPDAIPLAIRSLDKLRATGEDVKAVIEQSTLRNWTGFFAVAKGGSNGNSSHAPRGAANNSGRQSGQQPDYDASTGL